MSKPVKEMIIAEYRKRFGDAQGGVVVEIRGLEATATNTLRTNFRKKGAGLTVLRNALARKAFSGGPLEPLGEALVGPSAFFYTEGSIVELARDVVAAAMATKEIELKAAVLDGIYFTGRAGVEELSRYPTREEAQAKIITLVLAPAGKLLAGAKAPGAKILGIIKEIESRLEKGETIAAVS